MAGRNLLPLAQHARPRGHVVIIDFRRRRHRRIGKPQIRGLELVAAHGVERVGGLVEGDGVLFARREVADDDRGQRVGALQPHHVAGIEFDIEHIDALAIGIRSRQLARSGESSGAIITLKSIASSALVRMNSSSPRSASEYCTPSSRAATSRGGASGLARSISRCSEVS
jgi:hypothetical protein